jgi:hypothetical protein
MVRDEADVVGISVRHHLSLGLAEILVVDNGSSDGTDRILADLARRHPVRWARDDSGYRQAEIVSGLAGDAYRRGATWVLPFDADELWHVPGGPLVELLAQTSSPALECEVRNFVQARSERVSRRESLLSMTRRVAAPVGLYDDARLRLEAGEIAFVEMPYPPKLLVRAGPRIELAFGAHGAEGLDGEPTPTAAVLCLHAPLRSRAALDRKAVNGRRTKALGLHPEINWHLQRWARLQEEGRLEAEWDANSFAPDGRLDAYGRRPQLVEDGTLADLARRAL